MPNNLDNRYLNDLMDLLSPRGVAKSLKSGDSLKSQPIEDQVRNFIIDIPKKFQDLQSIVTNYYTSTASSTQTNTPPPAEDDGLPSNFHGISRKLGPVCLKKNYIDSEYWAQRASKESLGGEITKQNLFDSITGHSTTIKDAQCEITIMSSRDPYLSPAAANTEDVELFLNYMPSIVVTQMVPYLEVEFSVNKAVNKDPSFSHLSTPSLLRFLLGSVPWLDTKSLGIDKSFGPTNSSLIVLREADRNRGATTRNIISGMELFLAPQALTNMDTLKSSNYRLMDVKPFVPFASINNFEVQIMNAGAGAMSHKTGKLTLTLHDKSRIAEMSEFFRGPAGYSSVKIWTSYGWLAPDRNKTSPDADEYARFINANMHMEDCWQVKNTQFSFDQTGKVNLTLDLVGFGVSQVKRTSIKIADGFEKYLNGFAKILEEIQEASKNLLKLPLGPDARIVQVLNAGGSGGMLPADIKPEQFPEVIKSVTNYAKTAGLPQETVDKLTTNLTNVLDPRKYKQGLAVQRSTKIREQLVNIKGHDPFLAGTPPPGSRPTKEKFFSSRLSKEIDFFYSLPIPDPPPEKGAAPPAVANKSDSKEIPRPQIVIPNDKKVMSFGKLFCSLALPAIIEANDTTIKNNAEAEIQVIFYTLNDQCGPVSGQSIAEFPIDMERLAYSIDDSIKATNKIDLTIEEFLRVVINSQFTDDRSIGYGMLSKNLFTPFDKDKPGPAKNEKNKLYETSLAEWQSQNPVFAKPVIEMVFETLKPETNQATRINEISNPNRSEKSAATITRIHIYDKQNNPRKLLNQIANLSGKLYVGAFNDTELRRKLANKSLTKEQIATMLQELSSGKSTEEQISSQAGITLKTPDGTDTRIPVGATLFGDNGIRANIRKLAPTLQVGTNGSLIKTATLQSKTDDLMAAANLVNIMKPKDGGQQNSHAPPATGLEAPGGLPLRTVPAQLSMTTLGCPIARLYQQYFVDLGTGTSLDNLYTCTQVTHKLEPGKFETSMTFAFTDGYGKYSAPPGISAILISAAKQLQRADEVTKDKDASANKSKKTNAAAASSKAQNKPDENVPPENPPEIKIEEENPLPGTLPV